MAVLITASTCVVTFFFLFFEDSTCLFFLVFSILNFLFSSGSILSCALWFYILFYYFGLFVMAVFITASTCFVTFILPFFEGSSCPFFLVFFILISLFFSGSILSFALWFYIIFHYFGLFVMAASVTALVIANKSVVVLFLLFRLLVKTPVFLLPAWTVVHSREQFLLLSSVHACYVFSGFFFESAVLVSLF